MAKTPLRRRTAAATTAVLSAAIVLTGCSSSEPTDASPASGADTRRDETRSFEADNGAVEVPVDPQKVVAVGNAVGPVIDLGVEPVGVTVSSTNTATRWFSPEEVTAYEKAMKVSDGSGVNLEAVAALEPDLIVIAAPRGPWEQNYAPIEDRFQSIAPTVFIANNAIEWKTADERVADAVGRSDAFNEDKSEYEQLVADMRQEFASVIESTTFVQVNRYPTTDEGSFAIEYSGNWCTRWATEVGFDFPKAPEGTPSADLSIERLSDLAEYGVIIYPLEANGRPREELLPILEARSWKALPQVASGRGVGVKCPSGIGGYTSGITNLESLHEALSTLPAE